MPVWEWENPPEDVDVSRGGRHRVSPATSRCCAPPAPTTSRCTARRAASRPAPGSSASSTPRPRPLLRGSYTDATGRQLHRATGGLVAIAGICAYDSDAHGLAQRYFHQALRLAKASGDRGLGAYVIALLVNQSLFMREYRQAVAFAEAALRAAGTHITPALAADLYAMQAKAYAHLGDGTSALSCIRRAERPPSASGADTSPTRPAMSQPGLVNVQVAEALLSLGDLAGSAGARRGGRGHPRARPGPGAPAGHAQPPSSCARATPTGRWPPPCEMAEQARGMESQRLRDRLRAVREHLVRSGCAGTAEAAELIDGALRVPL